LRKHLATHQIETAYELGWGALRNGELQSQAEASGFEVLVTTHKNLKYQQNLAARRISVVALATTTWPRTQSSIEAVVEAVDSVVPGSYAEIAIRSEQPET
jgi:hypothetical protein